MIDPMHFIYVLAFVKGFIEKDLLLSLDYKIMELKIILEHLKRRGITIHFTDADRYRLAKAARNLPSHRLKSLLPIVQVDTLRKWWRILVKNKYNFAHKAIKSGRKGLMKYLQTLIITIKLSNPGHGYAKIQGVLKHLGHQVSPSTIKRVLKKENLDNFPPDYPSGSWNRFIKSHLDVLWACDFLTYETLSLFGPVTYYILVFINIKTRQVVLGGITDHPTDIFMGNMAKRILNPIKSLLPGCKMLIVDGDRKFHYRFKELLGDQVQLVTTTWRSPNLNAFAERFIRSLKYECLNHMILWSYRSLEYVVKEYIQFYNNERPHQGIQNEIPISPPKPQLSGEIKVKSRLGGMLKYYYREAA